MLFIKNARILTMTGTNYNKGFVCCDGEKIKTVGDMSSMPLCRLKMK